MKLKIRTGIISRIKNKRGKYLICVCFIPELNANTSFILPICTFILKNDKIYFLEITEKTGIYTPIIYCRGSITDKRKMKYSKKYNFIQNLIIDLFKLKLYYVKR